ncbi:MAG: hypothetical protein K6G56_01780 [Clostridiales bacterium]|nr:hypothetical protein [Clostridiales bacterium]
MAEDDRRQLIKRFEELAERAEKTGVPQETKFLNVAEQSDLLGAHIPGPYFLAGGYDGAERRVAVFGASEGEGYEPSVVCIRIAPASKRFADELTHKDFLGSLMALGITREVLGDIIVTENEGYLFCLAPIAEHVIGNLGEVKRTSVRCSIAEPPESAGGGGEERSLTVASERLDAVIAAVWKLPREEAKALAEKGLVYVDSRLVTKAGSQIAEGAVVSVRGRGRFRFHGVERETKKGRLRVRVTVC